MELDLLDDLDDVSKKTKNTLLKVGVDTEEKGRSGSFLQVDSPIYLQIIQCPIQLKLLNIGVALGKYHWV